MSWLTPRERAAAVLYEIYNRPLTHDMTAYTYSELVAAFAQAIQDVERDAYERAAQEADKWERGDWRVDSKGRKRFDETHLQTQVNCTGRGIAEDIRKLKETQS